MCRLWVLLHLGLFDVIETEAFQVMFVLAAPTFSFEVDNADLPSLVVCDCHLANLLDISRSKDQVLHCRNRSTHAKVLPGSLQTNMLETNGHGFELTK